MSKPSGQSQAQPAPITSAVALVESVLIAPEACSGGDDCFFCTCPETD